MFSGIDLAILGKHIASTTARLAMEGEFTQARVSAIVGQRLIEKNRYEAFVMKVETFVVE